MYVRSMDGGSLAGDVAEMRALFTRMSERGVATLTHPELLTLLGDLEVLRRQLPVLEHAAIARLDREATPKDMGAKSLKAVLMTRLRISGTEAKRRLKDAAELGPRVGLTGEPLPPLLEEVAEAQADGAINAEHVAIIRKFFKKTALPRGRGRPRVGRDHPGHHRPRPRTRRTTRRRQAPVHRDRPGRTRTRRRRPRPQADHHPRTARRARDEPDLRSPDPRSPRHLRSSASQTRRARDVQPRRRTPLHFGNPQPGTDRRRTGDRSGNAPTTPSPQ